MTIVLPQFQQIIMGLSGITNKSNSHFLFMKAADCEGIGCSLTFLFYRPKLRSDSRFRKKEQTCGAKRKLYKPKKRNIFPDATEAQTKKLIINSLCRKLKYHSYIIYIIFVIVTCARENLGPKWYIYANLQEDKILKLLYEQQGQKKWSDVAEIMRAEYGILGRNGKQCRER